MVSQARLQELRQKFRDEVVRHMEDVTALLNSLGSKSWEQSVAENIANHLHAVKGSAPILAAHPISHVARVAEECVHHLIKHPEQFSPEVSNVLLGSFVLMREQAEEFAAGRDLADGSGAISAIRIAVPSLRTDDHARTLVGKSLSAILGGEAPERPATEKRQRVLFVDDSQIAREVYKILLMKKGYDVEVASDGAEALQKLHAGGFEAVVTDDQMPEMDGIELLRSTRADKSLQHIPFVVISGKANDEARDAAVKEGAAAYLVKGDFQKEHLLEVLEQVLKPTG